MDIANIDELRFHISIPGMLEPVTDPHHAHDSLHLPRPRGDTFRQRWARHEVRRHRAGAKGLNHPVVGPLTFTYETMELAADEGLYLIVRGVAPGSRDADALNLLASWNATENTPGTALKQT